MGIEYVVQSRTQRIVPSIPNFLVQAYTMLFSRLYMTCLLTLSD